MKGAACSVSPCRFYDFDTAKIRIISDTTKHFNDYFYKMCIFLCFDRFSIRFCLIFNQILQDFERSDHFDVRHRIFKNRNFVS